MNRIRDATFILISVLAVVFLFGGYFMLEDKNQLIEATQKELKGVELERAMFKLLLAQLDERDAPTEQINSEAEAKPLQPIEDINKNITLGPPLLPAKAWADFKTREKPSEQISQLMNLIRDVGDSSQLILDPEMASYYLVDITINLFPPIIEHISQSRAAIVRAQTPEYVQGEKAALAPLITSLSRAAQIVQNHKTVKSTYGPDSRDINHTDGFYNSTLEAILNSPRTLSKTEWSTRFKEVILSYAGIYNNSANLLSLHLKQRIKENKDGRIFTIFFLFFIYCFVIIIGYFALKNYVQKQEVLAAREMTQMMRQLEKTNGELEHFAYVASHDLKEPLRTIASFAKLLQQKYSSAIDKTGQEYLDILMAASIRMQQMVSDLLDYARLDYELSKTEPFDCKIKLQRVFENLKQPIEQSGAMITMDDMPTINHHRTQFMQLMQNLISNAIKYSREAIKPEIHIGFQDLPDAWQFSVRDNGIGIDEAYFSKIFEPFKRLHTQHEFEGTGIGLAICKKMVERMGGKLWLTSTSNEGSTFYFTLVKPVADKSA